MNTNTKLIRLLRQLVKEQGALALVRRGLKSNKSDRMMRLLNFLVKNMEGLEAIEKEAVITAVDASMKEVTYRKLRAQLSAILEDTLAGMEFKSSTTAVKRYAAKAYKGRGMDGFFIKAARESIGKNLPDDDFERHLELCLGNGLIFFHPKGNLHIEMEYNRCFDDWFLNMAAANAIVSLKYYCVARSRKLIYGMEPIEELEAIFPNIVAGFPHFVSELLIVRVYRKAVRAIQELTMESYLDFKAFFLGNLEELKSEEAVLLVHLINVLNFVAHPKSRIPEYFELIKLGVENGYFVEDGYTNPNHFNNIVYVACEMKEIEWAENFIATHFDYLHIKEKSKINVRKNCTCVIEFAKGNYEKVLETLDGIRYEDFTYGIRKHVLELKCFYESEAAKEKYDLEKISRSFKVYINRKLKDKKVPISKSKKEINLNFIIMLKSLINFSFNGLKKKDLQDKLTAYGGNIAEIKWLQSKIDELK